ncbi:MAG: hypothetical protein A2252_05000 [Elusimicrobia bacterium RIFOXYA2_FULL_39_19]|nr:MAG: hypothetical protein A2252_05000 [Elusimicrobia bacterium RIFOXYA2_FULL_39_19]
MGKRNKADSKEIGLDLGIILSKYFFKTEHLHYGYWTKDLEVDPFNLAKAQDNHTNFIVSNIPDGTKTILDVGCGIGKLSQRFISLGYKPECVSPSKLLTKYAREILGGDILIHECKYEDLHTDKRYDLIVFSESYQYVDLVKSFENSLKYLNTGGHILICDFFKTDAKGESALGGGHHLKEFYETAKRYPLKMLKDIDITREAAPNLKLIDDFLTKVGVPVWQALLDYMDKKSPFVSKIIKWKFRKKIDKINKKYFSGTRNAENFAIFKSYRLFLFKKEA